MKHSMKKIACFTTFAISTGAQNFLESTKSEKFSERTNYSIIPTKPTKNFTNEIEDDPWWDWCAVFALCSVLSVCLIVGLLFIVTKFFTPLKEKDVIKFSSQKTRDGWYSDNLLATEQRTNGHCHLTEKDFIVVWS